MAKKIKSKQNENILKKKSEPQNRDDEILFAFLAAFLSIIGFLIALIVKKDNKYIMFYAKQSLIIFIIGTIAGILGNAFK